MKISKQVKSVYYLHTTNAHGYNKIANEMSITFTISMQIFVIQGLVTDQN